MPKRALLLYAVLVLGLAAAAALVVHFSWRVPVTTVQATYGPAVQAVYATGVVEPVHWAKVAPIVAARVVEIAARDGDPVAAGDVLARLEDREARAKLAELEAIEKFRREELERYAKLARTSSASRQAFERAASEHAGAVAAIAAARQRVRDLTLTAPMDGVVLRQDGEVGEVAETGKILFWIGRQRPLRIEAEVDEEDIPLVAPGQKAAVKADAFPDQDLDGTVREITPKGDPVSKNYRVRIALPDDTPLLIGMTTEVNIVVRTVARTLLVPSDAVEDSRLWIVADGRARQIPVTIGIRGDAMTEISAGLEPSARIVVDPPETLTDGARVRVRATARE